MGDFMVRNIFREAVSFEEAIQALQQGSRIRRKSERKGYTKFVITDGKNRIEKYGRFWIDEKKPEVNDYCVFELVDVLANDWVVEKNSEY
jgi:hypothetical protein